MTKILFWNIENFALTKIENTTPTLTKEEKTKIHNRAYELVQKDPSKLTEKEKETREEKFKAAEIVNKTAHAIQRFQYMMNTIEEVDPDIFIIAEVSVDTSSAYAKGEPMHSDNTLSALFEILKKLRIKNNSWSLVPPINVGGTAGDKFQRKGYEVSKAATGKKGAVYKAVTFIGRENYPENRESFAVYYKADKLKFIGPNFLRKNKVNVFISERISDKKDINVEIDGSKKTEKVKDALVLKVEIGRNSQISTPQLIKNDLVDYPDRFRGLINEVSLLSGFADITRGRTHQVNGEDVPEAQFAAKYEFFTKDAGKDPEEILFPTKTNRAPYLTRFVELEEDGSGNKKEGRVLNLFSIHTSPKGTTSYNYKDGKREFSVKNLAVNAVEKLHTVPDIAEVDSGAVNVVLGDFNVDTIEYYNFYQELLNKSYKMVFDPILNPKTPTESGESLVLPQNIPFCKTTLYRGDYFLNEDLEEKEEKKRKEYAATPYNSKSEPPSSKLLGNGVYPAYGYLNKAYDNFFVRYGEGAEPAGHDFNATIVNTVVGKPYNWPVENLDKVSPALKAGQAIARTVDNDLLEKANDKTELGGETYDQSKLSTTLKVFSAYGAFGQILKTSDHLPVTVNI